MSNQASRRLRYPLRVWHARESIFAYSAIVALVAMPNSLTLQARLEASLSADQLTLLREAAVAAQGLGLPLYLVGGALRDFIMGHPLQDIDLVVEGDSALFAHALVKALAGEVLAHSQFATAKVHVLGQRVDIVTARSETYRRPGALPTVRPGTIQDDLARRDFTINAIALRLKPDGSGELLDPLGGQRDIQARLIRILHPDSFQDDATRILRALRYEQRLSFRMEHETEALLRRDLSLLDSISGDRLRREMDLIFQERQPHLALTRLTALGVLQALYSPLGHGTAVESQLSSLQREVAELQPLHYLAWLAYPLQPSEAEGFIARLKMPKRWASVVRDAVSARESAAALEKEISPLAVYRRLKDLSLEAVQVAAALERETSHARDNLNRYIHQWRSVRPLLTGRDLVQLGVPQGPRVGELLDSLREARLEGRVHTREAEKALIRQLLAEP